MIDAAHDAAPIAAALERRRAVAIVAHATATTTTSTSPVALADELGAPIWIHPDDLMLWRVVYPDRAPDELLVDGAMAVGGLDDAAGAPHPGSLARRLLPLRRRGRRRVLRRHAVSGAARARPVAATPTSRRSSSRYEPVC